MSALLKRLAVKSCSLSTNFTQNTNQVFAVRPTFLNFLHTFRLKQVPTSIRNISTCLRRCNYKKIAFEMERPITEEVLVYSYKKDRFYKLMTVFGIGQFVFWIQLAHFSKTSLGDLDKAAEELGQGRQPWWMKYTIAGSAYKNSIALLSLTFGTLILLFCTIYPLRTIRQLTLLRGGNGARITVYSHFGKTKSFTAALDDINAMQGRAQASSNMSIKVRGRRFYYMLDKRDGVFHEPALFDYRVALKRW